MQGARDDDGCFPAGAGGKGKAPAPPPPPPHHESENDGGLRRRRRRRRWPVRGEVFAVGFMVAGAAYFLLADALAVGRDPADGDGDDDDPSAGWFFAAYMLWITGLNLYLLDYLMN